MAKNVVVKPFFQKLKILIYKKITKNVDKKYENIYNVSEKSKTGVIL